MSVTQARQLAEVSASGAVIGVLAGAVVGGMAAFVGQPVGWALTGAVTLAVPLALLGAVYGALVGLGRAKPGMFAPAALVWFVGFPARAPGARDRDSRPAGREPDPTGRRGHLPRLPGDGQPGLRDRLHLAVRADHTGLDAPPQRAQSLCRAGIRPLRCPRECGVGREGTEARPARGLHRGRRPGGDPVHPRDGRRGGAAALPRRPRPTAGGRRYPTGER
jgi:hypothetical protein